MKQKGPGRPKHEKKEKEERPPKIKKVKEKKEKPEKPEKVENVSNTTRGRGRPKKTDPPRVQVDKPKGRGRGRRAQSESKKISPIKIFDLEIVTTEQQQLELMSKHSSSEITIENSADYNVDDGLEMQILNRQIIDEFQKYDSITKGWQ